MKIERERSRLHLQKNHLVRFLKTPISILKKKEENLLNFFLSLSRSEGEKFST